VFVPVAKSYESEMKMEEKTCKIRKMAKGYGDKVLATYNPMIETEVSNARRIWEDEVVRPGCIAYANEGPGANRLLRYFEPVEDMIVVPAISGG